MTIRCSEVILQKSIAYTARTKTELKNMRSSKPFRKKPSELLGADTKICNIPALKDEHGKWVMDPKPKADLLAKTFRGKCKIPDRELNAYSAILPTGHVQDTFLFPTIDRAFKELSDLRENSGTGPDECPAKILKVCAKELAPAVAILTTRIIACMI